LSSDAARIVTESRCGIAVPPDDPAPLIAALRRLSADRGLREDLARGARRSAESLFSRRQALGAYEALLLDAANGHA
jgi:glycosyltransferase involved in cell wall biosynthesis